MDEKEKYENKTNHHRHQDALLGQRRFQRIRQENAATPRAKTDRNPTPEANQKQRH